MKNYSLKISLGMQGPIITSGGGDLKEGLNIIFFKNSRKEPVLQASHIKGKLREALKMLTVSDGFNIDVNHLFGKENGAHEYRPEKGLLNFTDFKHQKSTEVQPGNQPDLLPKRKTHVSIDPFTKTSKENFLRVIEDLFKSGEDVVWEGKIDFVAPDEKEANKIKNIITTGFQWITGMGASKGSGSGQLKTVKVDWEQKTANQNSKFQFTKITRSFGLKFEFDDDLIIGGIKKTTNYVISEKVISGAVLKGALAASLNRFCGVYPLHKPINEANINVKNRFPKLAEYFSQIRFTHAFPSPPTTIERAVVPPLSVVKASNDFFDVAFCKNAVLDDKGEAPTFQVDWKSGDKDKLDTDYGWANLETVYKTRTAIESKLRSADENKLYTYQYITPYCPETGIKIKWFSNICLPDGIDDTIIADLLKEIADAINSCWQYVGKRNSKVSITIEQQGVEPVKKSKSVIENNLSIICLQTDAAILNPADFRGKIISNLFNKYNEYWDTFSNHSLKLSHFYARQKLAGGYLFRRFNNKKKYYPYLLTEAGSVFVLEAVAGKEDVSKTFLKNWQKQGLPLPAWVKGKSEISESELWNIFPFIPQNGFGEIAVNLDWHWNNEIKNYQEIK